MGKITVVKRQNGSYRIAALKATATPDQVADYFNRHPGYLRAKGAIPKQSTLEKWAGDTICKATDGCRVEPDGICEHGHPSWLLALGYI